MTHTGCFWVEKRLSKDKQKVVSLTFVAEIDFRDVDLKTIKFKKPLTLKECNNMRLLQLVDFEEFPDEYY